MKKAKPPAVQFYTGDFLTGTQLMSNAEVGLYIRLLCIQAEQGSIPDDAGRLVQAFGPSTKDLWPAVRKKFQPGEEPGTLINERMSDVMKARDAFRERQAEKGRASAASRSNPGSTVVQPKGNHGSTPVEPIGDGDRDTNSGEKERASELTWPAFAGPKVKAKWAEFIAYRIREKRSRYKSVDTEQKALNLCARYFPSGLLFVEALDHSMARQWQFPVDPAEHKYPFTVKAVEKTTVKSWVQ